MSLAEFAYPEKFEVTVTTPDELAALQGLGLAIRRLSPDSSKDTTPLQDEAFWTTSQALFKTDVYGRGAGSYVHLLGEGAKSTATISQRGTEWDFDTQAYTFQFTKPEEPEGLAKTEEREDYICQALAEPLTPFPLQLDRMPDGPARSIKLRVTPGALTVQSLVAFVNAKHYPRHRLHGTIGKTLDVLTHAAGITPLHDTVESPVGDFMSCDELASALNESGIGTTAADLIKSKIDFAFTRQLTSGQHEPKGEVIFEGGFEFAINRHRVTVEYDRIARKTLSVIAADYTRDTPAKRVLQYLST